MKNEGEDKYPNYVLCAFKSTLCDCVNCREKVIKGVVVVNEENRDEVACKGVYMWKRMT